MKVVADSTPLISLSKIGSVNLLKKIFKQVVIPPKIYEETITEGKKRGKNEVTLLEKLIEEGFIFIQKPQTMMKITNLDEGEIECISLCKEGAIDTLLIDDDEGCSICQILNINSLRTTSLLLVFLDRGFINHEQYKELLKNLMQNGYFLDTLTYERLLTIGKNIAKK